MEKKIDPYERQLLAVFKSCDDDGTEALDRVGLGKLCDALQLEENHRNQLIAQLCCDEDCHVAFLPFRDALLALLVDAKSSTELHLDEAESVGVSDAEEEVSPKFIFGGKKYGRRSQPMRNDHQSDKDSMIQTQTRLGDIFSADMVCKKSNEEPDFEIETLCQYLGVFKDKIVSVPELISICTSLAIPNSAYEVLDGNIIKLKLRNLDNGISKEVDLTHEQLFQLIKKNGYLKPNLVTIRLLGSSTPFNKDLISNVNINLSGCVNFDTLVNMLENGGIDEAGMFLNDLGISPKFDVNLSELVAQLHEELSSVQRCIDNSLNHVYTLHNPHLLILEALVIINEARIEWYKSRTEQMQSERGKLRNDLLIANERADLLAQEVDENHARMEHSVQQKLKLLEQKHADQIKKLTFQWCAEREVLTNQNIKMEKDLEQLLQDETMLRSDIASLKQEYENLENENRNLLDHLANAEKINEELKIEIRRLSKLKKKVLEFENNNEQAISFLKQIDDLRADNTILRDKNDELAVELERVTSRQTQSRGSCSKRRESSPLEGDENLDSNIAFISTHRKYPKVRKYSIEQDLCSNMDGSQSENFGNSLMITSYENGVEIDVSKSSFSSSRFNEALSVADIRTIFKLRFRVAFLERFIRKCQLEIPDCGVDGDGLDCIPNLPERIADDLEKQCETLQQRLNQVQKEILKLLSEKRACLEENRALTIKLSELMKYFSFANQVDKVGSWLQPRTFYVDSGESDTLEVKASILEKDKMSPSENLTPEKFLACLNMFAMIQEKESEVGWKTISDKEEASDPVDENDGVRDESPMSTDFEKLLQDCSQLILENKTLKEKNDELSSCLDMLQKEYDQCEEYWASKLDDERKLFEEEQRISSENFAELKQKIKEYSEMYNTEAMMLQMSTKLPPIAENDDLEKEVNDLQEEFSLYKEKMELECQRKQMEIEQLIQIICLQKANENHSGQKIEDNETFMSKELSTNLQYLQSHKMENCYPYDVMLQQDEEVDKTMQGSQDQPKKESVKYCSDFLRKIWQSFKETTEKQAEQLALSDVLVKELYCENSQLQVRIHQFEQQDKIDCL